MFIILILFSVVVFINVSHTRVFVKVLWHRSVTSKPINVGEAAGIIAAQSIGEPGNTVNDENLHTGGVDLRKASTVAIKSKIDGKISFPKDFKPVLVNDVDVSYWITS